MAAETFAVLKISIGTSDKGQLFKHLKGATYEILARMHYDRHRNGPVCCGRRRDFPYPGMHHQRGIDILQRRLDERALRKEIRYMKKLIIILLTLILVASIFTACTEAEKMQHEMDQKADEFAIERHISITNLRTGGILYDYTGIFSLQNSSQGELAIIVKADDNEYRKILFSTGEDIFYIIEDIRYVR